MNKDRVEGKMKDAAGRVERQAGEWTDNPKMQVRGAAKQAEGKVQNAVGKMKDAADAARKHSDEAAEEEQIAAEEAKARRRRTA
jgi:uncharacterized protein YjbJ (UPF0337 family)